MTAVRACSGVKVFCQIFDHGPQHVLAVCVRAVDAGSHAALVRRLTAFEWAHEPALQAALAAAGGLPAPAEVRPDDGGGWALRSRRGHLLQVCSSAASLLELGGAVLTMRSADCTAAHLATVF